MNAADFYHLAVALSRQAGPAEMRSSISRAYYGAFNIASEVMRECGINLPKGPECHANVTKILGNCGDDEVKAAAVKLESLRSFRNKADYHLTDGMPEKKSNVVLQLQVADQIIQCLVKCRPGQPKQSVPTLMKSYARDVLRLPIT